MAVGGSILLITGLVLGYVGYVIWWNAAIRAAMALTRAKRDQALKLWTLCEDKEPWLAKDVFHSEQVGLGVIFVVLRDGSTEVRAAGPSSEWLAAEMQPDTMDDPATAAVVGVAGALQTQPNDRILGGTSGDDVEAPPPPLSQRPRSTWAYEV